MTARKDSGRGQNCLKKTTVFFKQLGKLRCSQAKLRNATNKASCAYFATFQRVRQPFFSQN